MSIGAPAIYLGPATLAGAADHSRDRAAVANAPTRRRRAVLVGTTDPHVSSLLTDVLHDIHLDVALLDDEPAVPDVVLAMVDRADGVRAIQDARARFPKAPVIAILTLGTHRLGTRAVAAGAQACYVLDMPLDRLRGLLTALLQAPASDEHKGKPGKPVRR